MVPISAASLNLIIVAIQGLVSIAGNLYKFVSQVKGDEPIPTWEEIIGKNTELQSKIDAEKE